MKNDAIWVFRTFGFKAGFRFVLDSLKLAFRRATNKPEPTVSLSDIFDVDDEEEVTQRFAVPERIVYQHDKTLN
jgi:ribosomal protein L35AE/L33A